MIYFDAILTLELVSVPKSLRISDSNFSVATGWENIAVLQMHPLSVCACACPLLQSSFLGQEKFWFS